MRDNDSGGALLWILLIVAVTVLLAVHICNGPNSPGFADETTSAPSICAPAPEQIIETEEDVLRRTANKILNCTVTYYCAKLYEHICGNGDGLTATGAPVVPYKTCAVDPGIIPLGSTVWVDYGDGVLHEYIAKDVGGAVIGHHIDLAVTTHKEANEYGIKSATVYWKEN